MTVARLYRENLRYALVAMAVQTVQPDRDVHRLYSPSWPVILAKTPVGGEQVIGMWPCNHLGFAYGDLTAQLVELAERLGIGYTVVDSCGVTYSRES